MRLFSEKVTPTYTRSAVNILTVEDFQEVFYDVYELKINNKQFVAEKVSEYKGAPVIDVPVIVEGVEKTLSFVLAKGKFEVLVGRSSESIPIEENYQTPRTIRYTDKGNTVEEVIYDSSEAINSEIKNAKEQVQKYNENVKLEKKIDRYIAECKNEIFVELENKYDDTILALERSDIELNRFVIETTNEALDKVEGIKSEFKNSLEIASERLTDSIELAESRIKNYYNNKLSLIEEKVLDISQENKQYFLDLVTESKKNLLKEISDLKKAAPGLINEKAFEKQGVDLKGIKSELEKLIGTRFSNEISALRRLIELSSGGGSVAMQFAKGGFMDGNLTVNGLISARDLTITGTISTTMLEALSANIRYLDINTYELSGFHSTGDVSIEGNLTVTGTISTTMLEATSANITYIDIKQYELSGFDVTGDVDIDGNLTVTGTISGKYYINDPTGRVILVDDITGIDTRSTLSKYDQFKPYKTIEAAVSDSVIGDLVFVRAGSYTITSAIELLNKGNIHFEAGTEVTANGGYFTISAIDGYKTITGYANFICSNTLVAMNGGAIRLECANITSTSSLPLFNITGGTFDITFNNITAVDCTVFNMYITGNLIVRNSQSVTCSRLLNTGGNLGSVDIDIHSVISSHETQNTIELNESTSLVYKGHSVVNNLSTSCLYVENLGGISVNVPIIMKDVRMKTAGIPILCNQNGNLPDIFLDSVKLNSITVSTPSISSSYTPTTIYSTVTYSNRLPDASVTVDGQYNLMTKLF